MDASKPRRMSDVRNMLEVRVGRLTGSARPKEGVELDLIEVRDLAQAALEQHFDHAPLDQEFGSTCSR
jgi:hypothetical protein